MKNNITLTILHNIFLTREQRYKLAGGEEVEAVGVSVPVWFHKEKTSEPGEEIFVKYRLSNDQNLRAITDWEEGYAINIPQHTDGAERLIRAIGDGAESNIPNANTLKDIKDGGSEWLCFKQYTKVHKGKRIYNILHFIEIKDIGDLEETVEYEDSLAVL